MVAPLLPLAIGAGLVAATTATVLVVRARARRSVGIPAQVKVNPIAAAKVRPARMKRGLVIEAEVFDPSVPLIDQAHGWEPVWVRKASGERLEWGACAWDYMKARQKANIHEHGQALKMFNTVWGKAMEWVIALIKAATADVSICWRIDLPAARLELEDGRSFWMPCDPPSDPAIMANPDMLPGFNPGTTHRGFPARIGKWPLGDKMPTVSIGGAWIRDLGDYWEWGKNYGQPVTLYQIVIAQDGVMKSFPAMSRRDWRIALLLGGETGGYKSGLTEVYAGGVAKWFKDWRCSGQKYKLHVPTTRKKAMNRFAQ